MAVHDRWIDDDQILGCQTRERTHHLLDRGRKQIDATDHQHVVGPAAHAADQPGMGSAAGAALAVAHDHVASPPAHQRARLLVQMGQHQHAGLAIGCRLSGFVDDLGIGEVLRQMQPRLRLALPADRLEFEAAVGVIAARVPFALEALAGGHDARARLPSQHDAAHARGCRIKPERASRIGQMGDERRRARQRSDAVIEDRPDLALGVLVAGRDAGRTESLVARHAAHAADEPRKAEQALIDVAPPHALRMTVACVQAGPALQISLGPELRRRPGSRPRGEVDAPNLVAFHADELAEGRQPLDRRDVVGLARERQRRQIRERLQCAWVETALREPLPVPDAALGNAQKLRAQQIQLMGFDTIARPGLARIAWRPGCLRRVVKRHAPPQARAGRRRRSNQQASGAAPRSRRAAAGTKSWSSSARRAAP